MARFGANVTGIDPTENSIKVSSEHAKKDPCLSENLKYIQTTSGIIFFLFIFLKNDKNNENLSF